MKLVAAITQSENDIITLLQQRAPDNVMIEPVVVELTGDIFKTALQIKSMQPDLVLILSRAVIDKGLSALLDHHRVPYLGPSNIDCEILDEYNDSISEELKSAANLR